MAPKVILAAFFAPAVMAAAINPFTGLDHPTRIIGGEDAEMFEFPYVVSLQKPLGQHFCTGSLIDAKTVLTAAHCVDGTDNSTIFVRAGSLSKSHGGDLALASSTVAHPDFDMEDVSNDVGIVKLSTPLPWITFATLARKHSDPARGTHATVAGWGYDTDSEDEDEELPDRLQKAYLPIVSRRTCRKAFGQFPAEPDILDSMICAGDSDDEWDNDESPCAGDSGGPLVDRFTGVVIGVTSWGLPGCGTDGAPNVFANVGYLRDFIDEHMEAPKHP